MPLSSFRLSKLFKLSSAFTDTRIRGVTGHGTPEVCQYPFGCMGQMAGYAACGAPKITHAHLVPVQRWSIELPATTVGDVAETSLPAKTLARTLDGPFNFLPLTFSCRLTSSSDRPVRAKRSQVVPTSVDPGEEQAP